MFEDFFFIINHTQLLQQNIKGDLRWLHIMDSVFILKFIFAEKITLHIWFFCRESSIVSRSTDIVIKATKNPWNSSSVMTVFLYNCQRWIENQRGRKLQTILGESHMYCETFQEFKWQSRTTNLQLQRQRKEKKKGKNLSTKEESTD